MNQPHLRAGNDDRERVIQTLQAAFAEGRVSAEELQERVATTQTAQTFGDLDAVVADLPVAPPSSGGVPAASSRPATTLATSPGSSMTDPLVLDAGWGTASRKGSWEIPQFLLLKGSAGSVKVNCLEATTAHQVIHVWIDGGMGMVTIVLPDGWAADTARFAKGFSHLRNKVSSTPTSGRPTLVVNGSGGMATIILRHANWFERRAVRKRLR